MNGKIVFKISPHPVFLPEEEGTHSPRGRRNSLFKLTGHQCSAMKIHHHIFLLLVLFALSACAAVGESAWQLVETDGALEKRHEAAFVLFQDKFYVMGGRGAKSVNVLDPKTRRWSTQSKPPLEIHHFQPVVYQDKIYILGAMSGKFPREIPVANIIIYDPIKDVWETGPEIPKERRRGAAGVVLYKGKFYMVAGIRFGHMGGYVNWLDEFDPATGRWKVLADAPHKRDHFQAVVIKDKIYAAGGRTTSKETKQVFHLVVPQVDVYDFVTGVWQSLPSPALDLPTPRAGTSSLLIHNKLAVIGGETKRKSPAHNEVEVFDPKSQAWSAWPGLVRGRHGTGAAIYDGFIWTCCGSGNRGGGPELLSTERFKLD